MSSMLTIGIQRLKIRCIIGTLARERRHRQTIMCTVSATINADVSDVANPAPSPKTTADPSNENAPRAASPAPGPKSPTIDYTALAGLFTNLAQTKKYYLIESLATAYQTLLLQRYPQIQSLSIEIAKPRAISGSCTAFVRLEYQAKERL